MGGGGRKWFKYERIFLLVVIFFYVCLVDEFFFVDLLRVLVDGEIRNVVVSGIFFSVFGFSIGYFLEFSDVIDSVFFMMSALNVLRV